MVPVGRAISLTIALDLTATAILADLTTTSATVRAVSADTSRARSVAAAAGVAGSGRPDASSLLNNIRTLLDALDGAATTSAALPTSDVPALSIPTIPAAKTPNSSGVGAALGAAAATGVNLEVSTTLTTIPTGTVDTQGALEVLATGDASPEASAVATAVTTGVATAIGIGVAFITLASVLGAEVKATGAVSVVTRIASVSPADGKSTPTAIATAGGGAQSGLGAAGAFALSLSAYVSIATVLPSAVITADGFDVTVYAQGDVRPAATGSAPGSGAGAVISIAIATNIVAATFGGYVVKARDVKVLAAADPADATNFPKPKYETTATAAGVP